MNKEKKNIPSWWKEFLTGVMATAIGVGLSFAVNNMVENHKKDQVRRHTAMMAVYDIDEIARQLKGFRQKEDLYFKVTTYIWLPIRKRSIPFRWTACAWPSPIWRRM